jgi:hypothetical protein
MPYLHSPVQRRPSFWKREGRTKVEWKLLIGSAASPYCELAADNSKSIHRRVTFPVKS